MAEDRKNEYRGADGRYEYFGGFDRVCVCGHTLGIHCAGGWDCFAVPVSETGCKDFQVEGLEKACDCQKFRPSRAKKHRVPA